MKPSKARRVGGIYEYDWETDFPHTSPLIRIDRIREKQGKVVGEIMVRSNGTLLDHRRLDLMYAEGQAKLLNTIMAEAKEYGMAEDPNFLELPWKSMIRYACRETLMEHRRGSPAVYCGTEMPNKPKWLLYPYLMEGQPNTIFGFGEAGKSVFSLALGLLCQTGEERCGMKPAKRLNVMVADYETTLDEYNYRSVFLKRGLDLDPEIPILYKNGNGQCLHDDIDIIKEDIIANDIELLIVDSFTMANGGSDGNNQDVVSRYFNSLAYLGITTLTLDHKKKPQEDGTDKASTPIGSIFKVNLSRNIFEMSARHTEEGIVSSMWHTKCNNAKKLMKPMGYQLDFRKNSILISPSDKIVKQDDFTLIDQMYEVLRKNRGMKARQLAEAIDIERYDTIRRMLRSYSTNQVKKPQKFVELMDGVWGANHLEKDPKNVLG